MRFVKALDSVEGKSAASFEPELLKPRPRCDNGKGSCLGAVKIPDFFIVGALPVWHHRVLAEYLSQHPDIFMASKEMHHFGSDLRFGAQFLHRRDHQAYLARSLIPGTASGPGSVKRRYGICFPNKPPRRSKPSILKRGSSSCCDSRRKCSVPFTIYSVVTAMKVLANLRAGSGSPGRPPFRP